MRALGFTLIELMISVAILSVISALAVASLSPMTSSLQAQNGAVVIAEAVARAREEARGVGRCYLVQVVGGTSMTSLVVKPGTETGNALLLSRWSSQDCTNPALAVPEEFVPISPSTSVAFASAAANPLVWLPNGRVGSASTAFQIFGASSTLNQAVIVEPQGPICIFPAASIGSCP